jgi:hypothetical protein
VELIGVGELGRQRAARDVAGQGRQGAGACVRHQRVLVEIVVQDGPDFPGPQLCRQAVSNPDCLGEQLVLRPEMGIEGAAVSPAASMMSSMLVPAWPRSRNSRAAWSRISARVRALRAGLTGIGASKYVNQHMIC